MYDRELTAGPQTTLTLAGAGRSLTVDLYSEQGLAAVSALYNKLAAEYRLMYEPAWLGVPIIQMPTDIVAMQELIWRLRPDFIVECGLAHGGSAVLYASICELLGRGRVIGVDIEVRQFNRVALRSHPLAHRIEILEGSSAEAATAAAVADRVEGARRVMVVLDSNHGRAHVARELELFSPLVTVESYMVVMDGAQAHVWDIPRGNDDWRTDHPLAAIQDFLAMHPEFEPDPYYERFQVTSCPEGFLRRTAAGEPARARRAA